MRFAKCDRNRDVRLLTKAISVFMKFSDCCSSDIMLCLSVLVTFEFIITITTFLHFKKFRFNFTVCVS